LLQNQPLSAPIGVETPRLFTLLILIVAQHLTNYARQRDENAQLVMLRFAIERLIYSLA
jgi:hypothetical protein